MIPTAGEFLESMNIPPDATWGMFDIDKIMIEFAKLHVEAALKAALESIPCLGSSTDIASYEEVEEEVLNAYPEELIK